MDSYLTHPPKPFNSIKPSIKPRPPPQSTTLTPLQGGLRLENKAILSKMGTDESGITNSTSYERTMHIVSVGTGHQGGPADGPRPKWGKTRNMKLKQQAVKGEGRFFEGVVAYVNGYTGTEATNRQLVEMIQANGGEVRTMESASCTHIFVETNLSGSKTQKFLNRSARRTTKLVTPAWAIESVRAGRKLREADFAAPVFDDAQQSIHSLYSPTGVDLRTAHSTRLESISDIPEPIVRPLPLQVSNPSSSLVPMKKRIVSPRKTWSSSSEQKGSTTMRREGKRTKSLPPVDGKKEEEKVCEVLDIDSEDEDDEVAMVVDEARRNETKSAEEEDEDEELDEWGMPPCGQR